MPALEARGVELSWTERGEGAPVLLIHDSAATSAAWEPLASALAAPLGGGPGARAISYDRRGWGRSTAPDGYLRTTIEEQSEDAAALLAAVASAPAVVCGAGTGGVIALDLMLRRPDLVTGAVLIEPPMLALLPEATEVLSADRRALEAAADDGRNGLVRLYLSGGLGTLGAGAQRMPEELTAPARERPVSLLAELGAVPGWTMPLPRLAEAERPSLILTCASTPALIGAASAALAARLAGAEELVTESPRLPPHLGSPAEVADAVAGLVAG